MHLMRGGVAALFAAGAAGSVRAQVVSVPARAAVRDTTLILRVDGVKVPLDSIRVLLRAFDNEPLSSMQSARMRQELESMAIAFKTAMGAMGRGGIIVADPEAVRQLRMFPARGWIGLTTAGAHHDMEQPGIHLVQYFDYPPIVSVDRKSPAQIAGILPGDTLIAYDGVDVVAHPINVTQLLTPEKKLAVTVRREGETKAFTLTVGRAPNAVFTKRVLPDEAGPFPFPDPGMAPGDPARAIVAAAPRGGRIELREGPGGFGQVFMITPNGVFGASMSPVGADLARVYKLEPGVLVNEVPEDTPAFRSGLKAGDVILTVGGQAVASVDDVRKAAILRGENHALVLQVLRDKTKRTIIVR
jgi:membrane-associated protease RseP (regulator of RpoE activity)